MPAREWLETDGLGGYASGTTDTIRTRRYHSLLLTATTPPTGRLVLVNGVDASVRTGEGTYSISSQRYAPDVIHPDGWQRIESFQIDPWPVWIFQLEDGTRIKQEILMKKGAPITLIVWQLLNSRGDTALTVRPFFSGRDYHSLHHENGSFEFKPERHGSSFIWHPYQGIPGIHVLTNGSYAHNPDWYRNFLYEDERLRGLDDIEDLAAPGKFEFDLSKNPAVIIFSAGQEFLSELDALEAAAEIQRQERTRRKQFKTQLDYSADAYIVNRKQGKTIVAGYPWFTDWGRDTFIAMRGICISRGEIQTARDILIEWSGVVSQGMLPNRFPDQDSEPEYNSVDASLWYVIAVHDLLESFRGISDTDRRQLQQAASAVLEGYQKGTRYGIKMDGDGLLAAGEPGVQLTWMDAKIGDWVVTPRTGKPVEIQALWLNALRFGASISDRWNEIYLKGLESFQSKFWNESGGYLYDVIDVDHETGKVDALFRPNQILAIGGLPTQILRGARARSVVDRVEEQLLTPLGLRSLAPGSSGYAPRYEGGSRERDSIYHQGVIWPWLIGPFVEAWLRVRNNTDEAKSEAHARFLDPLMAHLKEAGINHISEIADAEPPFTPRGCPFQAWSIGEAIRAIKLTAI